MDNLESVQWELKDRTAAHEQLVESVRQESELAEPKGTGKAPRLVWPMLASAAGLLLWLVMR